MSALEVGNHKSARLYRRPGRLLLEELEQRHLLAIVVGPTLEMTQLFLYLDDANNRVSLNYLDASTIRLTVNGDTFDYPRSDVGGFFVIAGTGNDEIQLGSDVQVPLGALPGEGDDLIVGGAGDDRILADTGNDTLIGGAGNDLLDGSDSGFCFPDNNGNSICGPAPANQSSDSVSGGDGDDTLFGDPAIDILDAGPGNNDIDTEDQDNSECISVDTTDRDPPRPNNIFFQFIGTGIARVTVTGKSYDFPQQYVECLDVSTGDAADTIEIDPSVTVPADVFSGGGNDTIIGSSQGDYLNGEDGDDSIVSGGGDDSVFGGPGSDTLVGGDGNDSLDGADGDDSISGGAGNDTLADGMGNDTLDGGGPGMPPGAGGNDTFIMSPGSDDVVRDDGGTDALDFSRAAQGISVDLSVARGRRQVVDAAGNTLTLRGDFEHALGSPFADDISGNGASNRIEGGGGDDTLDGGGGDRDLHGHGRGVPSDRRAGPGCDGDTLVGGAGQDWLDGGRGSDALDGGDGDDVLVGDPATDVLSGGAGTNQTVAITKTSVHCSPIAGLANPPGTYFDDLAGILFVSGDAAGPADDAIVVGLTAGGFVEIVQNAVVHSSDPASANFDSFLEFATASSVFAVVLRGLDGNDTLVLGDGFAAADGQIVLDGGAGNDSLSGSSAAELLVGGPGDDTLGGGAGEDTLVGGEGDDRLDGGPGSDTADFGAAPRRVKVNLARATPTARGEGSDLLAAVENVIGSRFNDSIVGDALANILLGGDGRDNIRGGDGDDSIDGGLGNDKLRGGNGTDRIIGGVGNDQLLGELGDDWLDGSSGEDWLRGGLGADRIFGGGGIDRLLIEQAADLVIPDALDRIKNAVYPPLRQPAS